MPSQSDAKHAKPTGRHVVRLGERKRNAESRAIREIPLSTEVSVLADGRVKFAEGLTAGVKVR